MHSSDTRSERHFLRWIVSMALLTGATVLAHGGEPTRPLPSVEFTAASQSGSEGLASLVLTLQLSATSAADVLVPYTVSGTASAGADYTLDSSPATIPAGQLTHDIVLVPAHDTVREPNETVIVTLGTPTHAVLGSITAHKATLLDDDGPGSRPTVGGLTADRSAIDFLSERMGSSSLRQDLRLTNQQQVPITFLGAEPRNGHAADFVVTYPVPPPVVLLPGQSVVAVLAFEPLGRGPRASQLFVRQAPHGAPGTVVALTGIGYGPTGAELMLNAGLTSYVDGAGEAWIPDFGLTGTTTITTAQGDIGGTSDDPLYRDVRKGAFFRYGFGLPDARYEVKLHFVELEAQSSGQRIFDVDLEGATILENLDIFQVAGYRNAWVSTHLVDVMDGRLEIIFRGEIGKAAIAAVSMRSVPIVTADPSVLDFGLVDSGDSLDIPFSLSNSGIHAAHATHLSFVVPDYEEQAGHDFSVLLDGVLYHGDHETIRHAIDLTIQPGETVDLLATFAPTEHAENDLWLLFEGNFEDVQLDLIGEGSGGGDWGYLHPVIDTIPELIVDFDQSGSEQVTLDGSDSHTHEPGHAIVSWTWYAAQTVIGTLVQVKRAFPLGTTEIALTIGDDNNPPNTATVEADLVVFPVSAVPGILTYYYDAAGIGASALLDSVPSQASFAERLDDLVVPPGLAVGGSQFTADVMVRMLGAFQVAQSGQYQFTATGGVDRRVFVDAQLYGGGSMQLAVGPHSLELRFAVDGLGDLPLSVDVRIDGQLDQDFGEQLVHDERPVDPLIHAMPTEGDEGGGNLIILAGFGFFPRSGVTVHWGTGPSAPDITASSFLSWTDEELQFLSPPSPGPSGVPTTITVLVETPNGLSNSRTFTYTDDGDVPIVFDPRPSVQVGAATCAEWGPDGRLYVGLLSGQIKAITFDENYGVVSTATYAGVSMLTNSDILGLAFNPFSPAGPVKLYVGHAEIYAQGGGAFSGPSPYPGQVSILSGPNFDTPQALIMRLPTSNHDHGTNGMQFDDNGDLLFAMGGNTNAGVKHPHMGDLPESPLSGAILKAELSRSDFDGSLHYLETATGIQNDDQVFGEVVDLAPGKTVTVHASGIRNAYDLVYTTWRMLYGTDNGPNSGFGRASTGPGSDGPDPNTVNDEILLVEYGNYYGHPNRSRARTDPRQYVYRGEADPSIAGEFTQMIGVSPSSTDGICEYRSATFNGQMRGELLVQKYGNRWRRIELSADHRHIVSVTQMENIPALDILTGPGGAVLPIDYGGYVKILVPNDQGAVGLTVYDITPWRAPVSGGARFVIGGRNFGTMLQTSVTIGGVPASLSSVSEKRIVGTIPAGLSPTMELLDVVVTVGLDQETLPAAFMALPATPGLAPGIWTGGTPLPEAVGEVSGGIVGRTLYLYGEGAGTSVKTYAYDLINEFWTTTAAQRPYPGNHHSTEVLGQKLYVIGGLGGGSEGKVQIFDPLQGPNGTWTTGTNMPWNGGSVSTALIGGKIYACGGIVASGTVPNCAVYDPVTDAWSARAPMLTKVNHAAAASDGQRMWVFGGRQGGNFPQPGFTNVQVYDPATNSWLDSGQAGSSLADMPSGRGGTGRAILYKGEFYVMGGETSEPNDPEADPGRVFPQVYAYNPVTNTWRQDARMPTARHGIYPILFQSRIHVIGGGVQYGHSSSALHEIFTRQ